MKVKLNKEIILTDKKGLIVLRHTSGKNASLYVSGDIMAIPEDKLDEVSEFFNKLKQLRDEKAVL